MRVQLLQRIEGLPLHRRANPWCIAQEQNGIARPSKRHSLVNRREESTTPVSGPATGAASRTQHHKTRQILGFASQTVGNPGTHARTTELGRAGVHENLSRSVIKRVRGHRLHDRDVVHDLGQMWQRFRQFRSTLAVTREFELGGEKLRIRPDKSVLLTLHYLGRHWLAVVLCQLWLVIKQIELTRRAGLKEINDMPGPGRKMWRPRRQRICRRTSGKQVPCPQETGERERTYTQRAISKKIPPCDRLPEFRTDLEIRFDMAGE